MHMPVNGHEREREKSGINLKVTVIQSMNVHVGDAERNGKLLNKYFKVNLKPRHQCS